MVGLRVPEPNPFSLVSVFHDFTVFIYCLLLVFLLCSVCVF